MSAIAPLSSTSPAPVSAQKAAKVRETLARVRQQYLQPFTAWEEAEASFKQSRFSRDALLHPKVPCPQHPRTEEEREQLLRRHDGALANHESRVRATALAAGFAAVAESAGNPAMNRVLAGLMIGAFPSMRPHSPETYLETLIERLDASGMSAPSVARVCDQIITTSKFPPTVSEVLEQVRQTEAFLKSRAALVDRYLTILDWADRVRDWISTTPLLLPDRSNYEHPPYHVGIHRYYVGDDW